MTYSPQTWLNGSAGGTPLSADRLNYIEQGILGVATNPGGNVTNLGLPGGVDDTALVHAARTAAGANATLVFGVGTYVVAGLVASSPGQRWVVGPNTTIRLKNAANAPVIDISANGVTIDGGGMIDGNRSNQTALTLGDTGLGTTACVRIRSVSDATVRRLVLTNGGSNGVFIDDATNVTVDDNRITNSSPGGNSKAVTIYDGTGPSTNVRVSRNTIDGTGMVNGCIGANISNGRVLKQLVIEGNRCLVGNAGATATLGIEVFTSGTGSILDSRIAGNLLIGPSGVTASDQLFGISVGGDTTNAADGDVQVAVTGNVIRNCPSSAVEVIGSGVAVAGNTSINSGVLSVIAVNVTGGITGVSLTGNTVLSPINGSWVFRLDGGTNGIFGLVVSGNSVRNTPSTASVVSMVGTISGASITGNTFTKLGAAAIVMTGTVTDSVIGENVIDLTGVTGSTSDGVLFSSTTIARVGINGNTIKGASRGGIYVLVACADISIVGNRITHCQDGLKAVAVATRWSVVGNTISDSVDRGLIFNTAGVNLAIASNSIHDNPGGNYYTVGSTFQTHVINGSGG